MGDLWNGDCHDGELSWWLCGGHSDSDSELARVTKSRRLVRVRVRGCEGARVRGLGDARVRGYEDTRMEQTSNVQDSLAQRAGSKSVLSIESRSILVSSCSAPASIGDLRSDRSTRLEPDTADLLINAQISKISKISKINKPIVRSCLPLTLFLCLVSSSSSHDAPRRTKRV